MKCQSDAVNLGWAVPCPRVLPGLGDVPWCFGGCMYNGGEPPVRMFYLEMTFPGPAPEGPRTVRHLVFEAFPTGSRQVLDPPCARSKRLPQLKTRLGNLNSFRCLDWTAAEGAKIKHGEAIHADHDLVEWRRSGITYVISVHRGGLDTQMILRAVAENIDYVSYP